MQTNPNFDPNLLLTKEKIVTQVSPAHVNSSTKSTCTKDNFNYNH